MTQRWRHGGLAMALHPHGCFYPSLRCNPWSILAGFFPKATQHAPSEIFIFFNERNTHPENSSLARRSDEGQEEEVYRQVCIQESGECWVL
jgi:hypothetical protein